MKASEKIFIGWTTVDSATAAEKVARGVVAARLASCAQVDGPVTSHYIWEGKQKRATEWRVSVKFTSKRAAELEKWLVANHPYSVPQWLAIPASKVAEPYRKWVLETTNGPIKRSLSKKRKP